MSPEKQAKLLADGSEPSLRGYPAMFCVFAVDGISRHSIIASQEHETYGSYIGSVDLNGDGTDEILLGEGTGPGQPHLVRIYSLDGDLLNQWKAY